MLLQSDYDSVCVRFELVRKILRQVWWVVVRGLEPPTSSM